MMPQGKFWPIFNGEYNISIFIFIVWKLDIGVKVSSGASSFESILGIPSIDLTVKNRHSATGDGYPYEGSLLDNPKNTKTYLKFEQAEIIAKVSIVRNNWNWY